MSAREFPIHVILSLTTGVLLRKPFGDVQELAEWVAGHPIWTHEFAEESLCNRLRDAVFSQHPDLRDAEEFVRPDTGLPKYIDAYISRAEARFGATRSIAQGLGSRTESPIASLQRVRGEP